MEVENPKAEKKRLKRKSASEDPSDTLFARKRTKKTIQLSLEFLPTSLSTPYLARPLIYRKDIQISLPQKTQFNIYASSNLPINPYTLEDFNREYSKFIQICDAIMGKKPKERPAKKKKISPKEEKLNYILLNFKAGVKDFSLLSQGTNLPRQTINYYWKKYTNGKDIFKDFRGRKKKKLNDQHCTLIKGYFKRKENFHKTVYDLYTALLLKFKLTQKDFSFSILYKYLKNLGLSDKSIIYKNINANTPSAKHMILYI